MHMHKYVYTVGKLLFIVCFIPERRVPLRLNYSKYGSLLTGDNLIRLAALLLDYSTREATLAVRNIVLDNPEIKVRVSAITCNKRSRSRLKKQDIYYVKSSKEVFLVVITVEGEIGY